MLCSGVVLGAKFSAPAHAGPLDQLNAATFAARTRYGTCAASSERINTGPIALPIVEKLTGIRVQNPVLLPANVDVDGNGSNDLKFTLVVVPTSLVGQPDIVQLTVDKLSGAPTNMLAEVILAPSGLAGPRVTFGYDGCEAGAPTKFVAKIKKTASTLDLDVPTLTGGLTNVKIIGGSYDKPPTGSSASVRPNPLALSARLEPVPSKIHAVVDGLDDKQYSATVTPGIATKVGIDFLNVKDQERMSLTGTLDSLAAGATTFDFTPQKIGYAAPGPMTSAVLDMETFTPPGTTVTYGTTDRMHVELTGLPSDATILRDGTKITFDTPGKIGVTKVRYASFLDGQTPGPLTIPTVPLAPKGTLAPEYLAANMVDALNAEVRLLNLSHAMLDTGDPVVAEITREVAAPFRINVLQDSLDASCPTCQLHRVERRLQTAVVDLPVFAHVQYSPKTGDYEYHGKGVIGELTTRVESSRPLVDDADIAKLTLKQIPSGLSGRIDSAGKTFHAELANGGAIATVEAQVTSGPDERLADGVDGIMLHDNAGKYVAFVRISGLSNATVGWGNPQFATLTHTAGPFVVKVNADDPDRADGSLDVDGAITNLPATAHVEYGTTAAATKFVYSGSSLINEVNFFAHRGKPFDADTGADSAHIVARSVPSVTIETDEETHTVRANVPEVELPAGAIDPGGLSFDPPGGASGGDYGGIGGIDPGGVALGRVNALALPTAPPKIGLLWIEVCDLASCRTTVPDFNGSNDHVWVIKRPDQFDVQALVRGLSSFASSSLRDANENLRAATVTLQHDAGPFDVTTIEDKVVTEYFGSPPILLTDTWTEVVDVKLRNLPKEVAFGYYPNETTPGGDKGGRVSYSSPDKIGSLDITFSKLGKDKFVVGRAPKLHVNIAGMPSTTLDYKFSSLGTKLVADTGNVAIDHLSLEAVGAPEVLTRPVIANHPITTGAKDGLLLWDLQYAFDGVPVKLHDPPIVPQVDPYALIVRASKLTHFEYSQVKDINPLDRQDVTSTIRVVAVRQPGAPNIGIDVRRNALDNHPEKIDGYNYNGFFPEFAYEHLYADYVNVPETFGVSVANRAGGGPIQNWVDIWGSRAGGSVHVDTDFAAITDLFVDINPIPAGTESHPGIHTCIAPNNMSCLPPKLDRSINHGQLSIDAHVNSPINAHVDLFVGDLEIEVLANVEEILQVGKEEDENGFDSTTVFLNTGGKRVNAQVQIVDDGDLMTYIYAPPNTRAVGRWVDVENEGVNDNFNYGQLMCPYHFEAKTWVWQIRSYLSLADDICTRAVLTNFAQPTLTPGGSGVVDIYGWSLADGSTEANVFHDGTRPTFGGGITYDNWTWVDVGHIQVTVHVPANISPGNYGIGLTAPPRDDPGDKLSLDAPASCSCRIVIS